MTNIYGHTLEGRPPDEWELLSTHLDEVAALAGEYAAAFGAKEWGDLLGRWHDLGKYSDAFQDLLHASGPDAGEQEQTPGRVNHSTFGARHARGRLPGVMGQLLAVCIAGHHGGLPDALEPTTRGTLGYRMDPGLCRIPPVVPPSDAQVAPKLALPWKETRRDPAAIGFSLAFFARMLFSCLIDADRTATERFCDRTQADERNRATPTLAALRTRLDAFLSHKQATAAATPVNAVRRDVLAECLAAAALPVGFFSLNVPTGGGKTFASLAFALHHAAAHPRLRRVVVGIPFTSIIEQTADQYRQALGPLAEAAVIEHHSNLNPARDTRQNKLASENWSAPLVVTTNVQLLESLFAARTTPARKLHRLAHSVIVLDEAQTLPVDLLAPTLAALRELVAHYGCTVVLCTATQPALEWRAGAFEIGIENVRPIIADVDALHAALRRVTVERVGKLEDAALADRLAAERQVLCVVNTKAHAATLYDALVDRIGGNDECFHLSTFMCPRHRRDVLADVRRHLADGRPCRVVSTQLVEAGVDLDFPCVYRAEAGFDSIAQAAGRCNREGKLTDAAGGPAPGRVYVFDGESPPPKGLLLSAAYAAAELADAHPQAVHDGNEKKPRPQKLLVPGQGKPSGSGINPCFLWDNSGYLLGFKPDDPKPERTRESFEAFRKKTLDAEPAVASAAYSAVCAFLKSWSPEQAADRAAELTPLVTNFGVFRISGETAYVHDDPAVVNYWAGHATAGGQAAEGFSLVTGQREPIATLHEPKIKGVAGGLAGGGLLVSFNAKAYESYGKDQGENAPVGVATTFKYTNALNYLLGRPDRRTGLGDATYTYWAKEPAELENYIDPLFSDAPPPKADAPPEDKRRAEQVRQFLTQLRDGHAHGDAFDRESAIPFYVLGLSPNAARISVRFWEQTTVGELERRLARHLQDMHLSGAREGDPPQVIRRVVEATGRAKLSAGQFQGYDADAVSPVLAGAMARAVFTGNPYPATLLTSMLNRLRADGHVSHVRVAAVKASLVRADRKRFSSKEALVALDTARTDPAYVTGRLFALLERIQSDAAGGDLNATIKDRYFSAASSTPGGVFPRLIRLSQHHLSSLGKEKAGLKVNHDRLYGEIMGKLDNFATQLGLEDQGLFAVGYYHQRQDFFTKKTKDEGAKE